MDNRSFFVTLFYPVLPHSQGLQIVSNRDYLFSVYPADINRGIGVFPVLDNVFFPALVKRGFPGSFKVINFRAVYLTAL